jgi:hypothetical protein
VVWHDFFLEHGYAEVSIEDSARAPVPFAEVKRRAERAFDTQPHLANLLQRH